jgi:hypothetical protein
MEELEKRKNEDLRVRIEREQIKKVLTSSDQDKLQSLEAEKKRELVLLSKEREALVTQEESIKSDIERMTEGIKKQERILREAEAQFEVSMMHEKELEEAKKRKRVVELAQERVRILHS